MWSSRQALHSDDSRPGLGLREGKKEGAGQRSGVGGDGVEWSRVEWSGVRGECEMGSVSCIFWLKAQDGSSNHQRSLSRPESGRLVQLTVDYESISTGTLVQNKCNRRGCVEWLVVQRHELMLLNAGDSL